MAIYKLEDKKTLIKLEETSFVKEKINEATDIQNFLIEAIEVIEEDLFVLASEFSDWKDSKRRIDILCIDKDANLVVIELKRTEDGGHMELQAIRYAAMLSNMTFEKAIKAHSSFLKKNGNIEADAKDKIMSFLKPDNDGNSTFNEEDFARDVRIILVSADFSIEITTSVLWLIERDLDIKCIRIKPQKDNDNLYLDIQQIIPLPETADFQVKFKEKMSEQRHARKEHNRDYSKYIFNNREYNKGRLVNAVIKEYVSNNSEITFKQLKKCFPDSIQGNFGVFDAFEKAEDIYQRWGHKRHYIKPEEVIELTDQTISTCTQWNPDNIKDFIEHSDKFGLKIELK